jgi:hypothetical protein
MPQDGGGGQRGGAEGEGGAIQMELIQAGQVQTSGQGECCV